MISDATVDQKESHAGKVLLPFMVREAKAHFSRIPMGAIRPQGKAYKDSLFLKFLGNVIDDAEIQKKNSNSLFKY